MTLPKGFGGGGGGASRSDVEGMIGKRIENYTSLITLPTWVHSLQQCLEQWSVTCIIHGHTHQQVVTMQ